MLGEFILLTTAVITGFIHTILGPDHYLPFIAIAKARRWTTSKLITITFLCGLGHVVSSVFLGFIGIYFGMIVSNWRIVEAFRGDLAAWFLIAFGFTYFVWGVRHAFRNNPHQHPHEHGGGENHSHVHSHKEEHFHLHYLRKKQGFSIEHGHDFIPWALFLIFIFGPCEPLIPLLMYPAAKGINYGVVLVALLFGISTITTMIGMVMALHFGLSKISLVKLEPYSHALAGLVIFLCGGAMKIFGI